MKKKIFKFLIETCIMSRMFKYTKDKAYNRFSICLNTFSVKINN